MTFDDRRWMERALALGRPGFRRFVERPGGGLSMPAFRVYGALTTCHRWLWVRGIEV